VRRSIITVGLGFGDEGKGATADHLCRRLGADLVVRYSGGSQAGHNVQLPGGGRHTFSQFGAGTLAGVSTYLGRQVILNPPALVKEAEHLRKLGVRDPFATLSLHPKCLVSTYLHRTVNRLRELARGDRRHGSCGHGIGEARSYWLRHGDDAIYARDLQAPEILRDKLELLKQRLLLELQDVADNIPAGPFCEYDLLGVSADALAESLCEVGRLLRIESEIPDCTTAIFEGAQGVLLDEWYGFHPHTTWSTVTPHHALEMTAQAGAEEVCVLGLVRPYMTRHGAGPLPTHDDGLTARIDDKGNPWNAWQGDIRAGWLDMVLLRYAALACGPIDNLAVSCLDHLGGESRVCTAYEQCDALPIPAGPNLRHQERLTEMLREARPIVAETSRAEVLRMLATIAPVAIEADGPTHEDRVIRGLRFRPRQG
jgi:adenylosuccinate synthase